MCRSVLGATKKSMVNTSLWRERAICTKNAIPEPINLWLLKLLCFVFAGTWILCDIVTSKDVAKGGVVKSTPLNT